MSETKALLEAWSNVRRDREPAVLATVVDVRGSAYRHAGARSLITETCLAGSVSGGCVEKTLVKKAFWHTRHGDPVLLTYDSTAGDDGEFDYTVGCGGVVDVLLERIEANAPCFSLDAIERSWRAQESAALVTVFRTNSPSTRPGARAVLWIDGRRESLGIDELLSEKIFADARAALSAPSASVHTYAVPGGEVSALIEAIVPPIRLFVFGTGADARPVVELGRTLGWDVIVCARSVRSTTLADFGNADATVAWTDARELLQSSARPAAVVMLHDFEGDRAAVELLLETPARYIGVLGAAHRTRRIFDDLGVEPAEDPRIRAPVGLALSAETPAEIALAIVAEIQASLGGRSSVSDTPRTSEPARRVA